MHKEYTGPNEYIDCECGTCGQKLLKYNKWGRLSRFIIGHNNRGNRFHLTDEQKQKISEKNSGRKRPDLTEYNKTRINPNFKEDGNQSYVALHDYVKRRLPKTEFCEICFINPSKVLANITGIYNRERKNWGWFCYKCHANYDNIGRRSAITRSKKSM